MVKKMAVIILSQFCFLMMLSCAGKHGVEPNKMYILISDYYQRKLTFRETNGNKIINEKVILDLTESPRRRIVQARFLSSNIIYAVFEGIRESPEEIKIHIQMYDIANSSWSDISVYTSIIPVYVGENDNIRIMDVEKAGGYFSGYDDRTALFYWDFSTHESKMVFEFPGNEEIVTINCRSNERFVGINTHDEKEGIYHYYFIDKNSYENTCDGIGRIYASKFDDFMILEDDSKTYVVDNLFNVQTEIEIPVNNGKEFFNVIDVGKNSFVICFYSTIPDYLGSFLFGGERVIERYDYKAIEIYKDDKTGFGYDDICKFGFYFRNKQFFDALIIEEGN